MTERPIARTIAALGMARVNSDGLAMLLQAVSQASQETQRLFAPWFQLMEMQINRVRMRSN